MKKTFPLELDEELHELLTTVAFIKKISKQQYCLNAIRKEALKDTKGVKIIRSDPE